MITLEGIKNNLEKLVGKKFSGSELYNEIVCSFEDYEYEGEGYVVVSDYVGENYTKFVAYVDHEDAQEFCIYAKWKRSEQEYTVTEIY